jgi:hypothetical protein
MFHNMVLKSNFSPMGIKKISKEKFPALIISSAFFTYGGRNLQNHAMYGLNLCDRFK